MSNEISKIIDSYNKLSFEKKQELFQNANIFRGLIFSNKDGIKRSFHDLYSWKQEGDLPSFARPLKNTFVKTECSFSKMTHELKKMNVDTASVSFSSPYASGESEYKHEKGRSTSSSQTNEYLLAQFIVRYGEFNIDFDRIAVSTDFVKAVAQAVDNKTRDRDRCENLIEVLNKWGYYVPQEFSLGGILYSEKITQISEYSQANTEKSDFSASFKASFDGIGGGAAYSNSHSTEETQSSTTKYERTDIYSIGGVPGMTNDYPSWASSLHDATFWDMGECICLMPTLMLLLNTPDYTYGNNLLGQCLQLLDSCHSIPVIRQAQPYIDFAKYALEMESKLNPF